MDRSALSRPGREKAKALFQRLAEVEAAIHRMPVEQVHLHEVGALDSIVDIVGIVFAMEWVEADRIMCSPLNVGGGMVQSAHGLFPVPAPATLSLLGNAPVYSGPVQKELVTPTGALIATSALYGARFGGAPLEVEEALTQYGERIGTAFQLSDDILDIASDSVESGKTPGTDLREGVATLPMLIARRSTDPADARLLELLESELTDDARHAEALGLLRRHPVQEVSLTTFAGGRGFSVVPCAAPRFDTTIVVARARSRLGEDCYRLWSNNCEHFTSWCLHGVARSLQVETHRARWQRPLVWLRRVGRLLVRGATNGPATSSV